MKTVSNWKVTLGLVAIFGLGAASGSLITARLGSAPGALHAGSAPEERWQKLTLDDYQTRLNLTPEQVAKLRPIFGLTGRKLGALRASTAERVTELLREMNTEIMLHLSEQQGTELQALLEARRHDKR
jgi:hypothetical protein